MKKLLLLLSLTILLFSCEDNTETIIEEECEVCWEFIEVVKEVRQHNNPNQDKDIIYTVTGENTCTGEQKTGVLVKRNYDDWLTYVGQVMCEGLFEERYTFE
jgi:hypothetical protein